MIVTNYALWCKCDYNRHKSCIRMQLWSLSWQTIHCDANVVIVKWKVRKLSRLRGAFSGGSSIKVVVLIPFWKEIYCKRKNSSTSTSRGFGFGVVPISEVLCKKAKREVTKIVSRHLNTFISGFLIWKCALVQLRIEKRKWMITPWIMIWRFITKSKLATVLYGITRTYLYNFDPRKPHFYIVKLGFTGMYIIFVISAQKHRLWVLVRTASTRRF